MKLKLAVTFLTLTIVLLFASQSFAQSLYGDFVKPPTDLKRGFYLGTESGFLFFLNSGGQISNPGYNLTFFFGHNISDYLTVEGRFRSGINSGWSNDPINGGIYTFQANGLVRGSLPINRVYPFVDVGGGLFFTHPEFDTGLSKKMNIEFGFGAQYYTFQRHFSLAIRGAYDYIPSIPDALVINITLRYTF